RAREPRGACFRGLIVPRPQIQRDLAGEAGREPDNAFVVLLQHFLIDAWPAVKALEEPYRRKLDQVLVTRPVFGEQHEVRVCGAQRGERVAGRLLARVPAAEPGIALEA